MGWTITIDQQVGGGFSPRAQQRYGPYEADDCLLGRALERALRDLGLARLEGSTLQITAVPEREGPDGQR